MFHASAATGLQMERMKLKTKRNGNKIATHNTTTAACATIAIQHLQAYRCTENTNRFSRQNGTLLHAVVFPTEHAVFAQTITTTVGKWKINTWSPQSGETSVGFAVSAKSGAQ